MGHYLGTDDFRTVGYKAKVDVSYWSIRARSNLLTQRSETPSRAGIAAALATGVTAAALTHAGAWDATAPG